MHELERKTLPAGVMLALLIVKTLAVGGGIVWLIASAVGRRGADAFTVTALIGLFLLLVADIIAFCGFFTVHPNEAKVLQLFGRYVGTVREPGLRWANPFYTKRAVSVRVRNFESGKLKVNDRDGNPIEIGAVVVWKVVDTAEACFHVDNYDDFVHVQSEAALRNLATRHPYDAHEEGQVSLRGNTAAVAEQLRVEVQERLHDAGVEVLQARISHLAYAPEIAAAMLRRQQAAAVVAARHKIVEGAVGMVEHALSMLSKQKIVDLDEERKAAMVSNLLVVLCGEHDAHPVVNTGTLHN
jgi:regulator of protease activity HflC (stomatin/prohibitin superfamily)